MKYKGIGDFSSAGKLIVPIYASQANFPAAASSTASFAFADDTNEIFYSDGAAWVSLTPVTGAYITGSGASNQLAYFTGTSAIASTSAGSFNGTDMALGAGITSGQRLKIVGGTSDATTYALRVHNSGGANDQLVVRNDGRVGILTSTPVTAFHVAGAGSMGDNVTVANAIRALNLCSTNAVMRILRVSADSTTAAPAIELLHRTSADGANTLLYDMFADINGLYIRDRKNLADVKVLQFATNGSATLRTVDAATAAAVTTSVFSLNSSGAAATGFGHKMLWQLESSTTNDQDAAAIEVTWSDATHASRTSLVVVKGVNSAGALGEMAQFLPGAQPSFIVASAMGTAGSTRYQNATLTTGTNYTIGNSGNTLSILSANTSQSAIRIGSSAGGTLGSVAIGPSSGVTITTGYKPSLVIDTSFVPTSGTGTFSGFEVSGTINQTGGASGISRGGYFNHSITAAADYRAVEIATNSSSAKGIYQTGASTVNNLVGKTAFGSTTAPTDMVTITGNNRVITGQQWSDRFALTDGATINTNWDNGNTQSVTLGGNRTMAAPTNPKDGATYTYIIKQDATGGRTLTWFTIKWAGGAAPTLTATANKYDIITLKYDGTNYYGTAALNF